MGFRKPGWLKRGGESISNGHPHRPIYIPIGF